LLDLEREKFLKMLAGGPHATTPIDVAIDSYEHALFGVYPRARYVVGTDAKIGILIQMLPECLSDWIICSRMPPFQKPDN